MRNLHRAALAIAAFIVIVATILIFRSQYSSRTLYDTTAGEPYFSDDFNSYDSFSKPIIRGEVNDLSRWQSRGTITLWADITNRSAIDRIDIKLIDSNGVSTILEGISNLQIPVSENKVKSNDAFPDYTFRTNQSNNKWEDFLLVNGTNFLFYEFDNISINMSRIIDYEIITKPGGENIKTGEVRIQDGLTRWDNPTEGRWYAPNGLPQFGVFWIDNGSMVVRNVRQTQYPSNGDHGRILSAIGTPRNFALRTRFHIDEVGGSVGGIARLWKRPKPKNTYFRVAWDFENAWDPGHDQTIAFFSFEYGKFGVQRVYPIERYVQQGYEPPIGLDMGKTNVMLQQGKSYEIDAVVVGQDVRATVYEVGQNTFRKLGEVQHTFTRLRPTQSFPLSFEFTGDVKGRIDSVDVKTIPG